MDGRDRHIMIYEIRKASLIGYAENVSIVDTLLDAHWCDDQDLYRAYETVQNEDMDLVVALFQLPFLIRLPEGWIRIKAEYGNPYAWFRTVGTRYNTLKNGEPFQIEKRAKYNGIEKLKNARLPNDLYGLLARTQVLMSFQLWGKRSPTYPIYLDMLRDAKAFRSKKIYPAKGVISLTAFDCRNI